MRKKQIMSLIAGVVALLLSGAGIAQAANAVFAPGEIIVKFKANASANAVKQLKGAIGTTSIRAFKLIGAEHMRLPKGVSVQQAIKRLKANPAVEFAEPNYQVRANVVPNDTNFSQLWGMHNTGQSGGTADADIDAPEAWDITTGDQNMVIAVIDSGVNYNHPDLVGNIWTNPGEIPGNGVDDDGNGYIDDIHGWDWVNGDGDPMDDNGHGSHCSGTIAGKGNNANGVAGVNWNAKIMGLKFLDATGSGWTSDAILAVQYATAQGVRVSNNSWGGGGFSQAMFNAIAASNSVFVAAAGNYSSNNDITPHYPSNYDLPNVISVAATDHNDTLATFSNYGTTTVDIAAPGVSILSTVLGTGYSYYQGTSMAAPHVTGVVALVMGHNPALTVSQVVAQVLAGADPKGLPVATGGRLNAFNSLSAAPAPTPAYALQLNTFTDCVNVWFDPADGTTHGNVPVYGPSTVVSGLYAGSTVGLGFNYLGAKYMYKFMIKTWTVDIYSLDAVGSTKTLVNTDTWTATPGVACTGVMSNGAGNTAIK